MLIEMQFCRNISFFVNFKMRFFCFDGIKNFVFFCLIFDKNIGVCAVIDKNKIVF